MNAGYNQEQFFAIQRRCGERTANAYVASLRDLSDIELIEGNGLFGTALATLDAASRREVGWSLAVDGDIRLYPGVRSLLEKVIRDVPEDVYQLRFACDDKILGMPVFGVHLHRNRMATRAARWFRYHGQVSLRAESTNMKNFLAASGLRTLTIPMVVGSHDFGQYYRDLAVKYVIRALRYRSRLDEIRNYLLSAARDFDTIVALVALQRAHTVSGPISPDRSAHDGTILVRELGLVEKNPMTSIQERDDLGVLRVLDQRAFP